MKSLIRKVKKVLNAINLQNMKSVLRYIKNNGFKGLGTTIINKIRFGKVVLDEYATWIANNEPNTSELENEKKYESCQNLKFDIICPNDEKLIKSIENQTYKKYNVYKENIDFIVDETVKNLTGSRTKKLALVGKNKLKAMLKYNKYEGCTELASEKLSYEIAKFLNLKCARVELAKDSNNVPAILNYYFLNDIDEHMDALYFLRKGIDGHDRKLVAAECPNIHVTLEYDEEGKQQVILNGENVTGYIRKEEVGKMASVTSAVPEVRAALLDLQRDMAKTSDILMDGRDIGTNVLPDASLKIYLTASADVRAKRRYDELKEKGADCDIEQIKTDIIARDKQDMEREIAPLCQAEDAILVDSSDMSIPQVIDTIISEFKKIK